MIAECVKIRDLKSGGQKNVVLHTHPIKGEVVLKTWTIQSFTSLERIKREVTLLTDLDSEYYPKQYHFFIDVTANTFSIVEEFIPGTWLRDDMSRFIWNGNAVFELLAGLVDWLSIIWSRDVIHRDLKPENIIIKPSWMPCIIDLGIARFLELDALTKTISPVWPCTYMYAAPEQLVNEKNMVDHRTDFFCLGIIALELYLGVHPFDPVYVGNQPYSLVENVMMNNYITSTPHIPEDSRITEFAKKTLAKRPYERIRTPEQLKAFILKQI